MSVRPTPCVSKGVDGDTRSRTSSATLFCGGGGYFDKVLFCGGGGAASTIPYSELVPLYVRPPPCTRRPYCLTQRYCPSEVLSVQVRRPPYSELALLDYLAMLASSSSDSCSSNHVAGVLGAAEPSNLEPLRRRAHQRAMNMTPHAWHLFHQRSTAPSIV